MNFVRALGIQLLAGDEADGPHRQRWYDPAMEENYDLCDQILRIAH
jgi:hypothetical protein